MGIKVERPTMGARRERELANLMADRDRIEATLDYVAMMADVEIPEGGDDEQFRAEG